MHILNHREFHFNHGSSICPNQNFNLRTIVEGTPAPISTMFREVVFDVWMNFFDGCEVVLSTDRLRFSDSIITLSFSCIWIYYMLTVYCVQE